jgi:hypothetical protein
MSVHCDLMAATVENLLPKTNAKGIRYAPATASRRPNQHGYCPHLFLTTGWSPGLLFKAGHVAHPIRDAVGITGS